MVSFGAVFGTTVMARLGLFIPRLKFLFGDWIHLIPPIKWELSGSEGECKHGAK